MTALDLIKAAFRVVGVTSQGNPLSAEDAQNGLEALQILLKRWGASGIVIPQFTTATATLVPGTGEYSIGIGGDINATRPTQLRSVFIRDSSGNDYHVAEISHVEYQSIGDKDSTGRPFLYWYNPTMLAGTITLWPVPDKAETLHVAMLQPLSTPVGLTDSISFPPEYDSLIKWSLSVELFPEYGLPVNPDVAALASAAITPIIANNAAAQMTPVINLGLPSSGSSYNINTDQ